MPDKSCGNIGGSRRIHIVELVLVGSSCSILGLENFCVGKKCGTLDWIKLSKGEDLQWNFTKIDVRSLSYGFMFRVRTYSCFVLIEVPLDNLRRTYLHCNRQILGLLRHCRWICCIPYIGRCLFVRRDMRLREGCGFGLTLLCYTFLVYLGGCTHHTYLDRRMKRVYRLELVRDDRG